MARLGRGQLKRRKKQLERELKQASKEYEEAVAKRTEVEEHIDSILTTVGKSLERGTLQRDEFYQLALDPEFPDKMLFSITAQHDEKDKTFSREGIESVTDQIHDFIMARIFGHWKATDDAPKEMEIEVNIRWKAQSETQLQEGDYPYYSAELLTGLKQVDGSARLARRPLDKR